MGIRYATREQVMRVGDIRETARANAQIDRLLLSSTEQVEQLTHRVFYPLVDTRQFDWPARGSGAPAWDFDLGPNEMISVSAVVSGGVTLGASTYALRRYDERNSPPYTYLQLDTASASAFSSGSNPRRSLDITGLYGFRDDNSSAGATASSIDADDTSVNITDSSRVGTWSLIRLGTERLHVTRRALLTTGQTLTVAAASNAAATTLTVADSSGIFPDEIITVGAERMLVEDVPTSTTLIVHRAWSGSVLGAHSIGATLYAPRTLTVERGVLGTTAAAHNSATALELFEFPSLAQQLTIGLTIEGKANEDGGYARTTGSGDNEREATARSLRALEKRVYATLGRMQRSDAV